MKRRRLFVGGKARDPENRGNSFEVKGVPYFIYAGGDELVGGGEEYGEV